MLTREDILMGRDKEYPLTLQMERNLEALLNAMLEIEEAFDRPLIVSSGYRPGKYNKNARGAKRSAHLTCEAVDVKDPSGLLARFCRENIEILEKAGLYMEDPSFCDGWVHLQTRPTHLRIFKP